MANSTGCNEVLFGQVKCKGWRSQKRLGQSGEAQKCLDCLGSFDIMSLHVVLVLAGWCCSYGTTEWKIKQLKSWLLTQSIDILPISNGRFHQKCLGALFIWSMCTKVERLCGLCKGFQTVSAMQSAPEQKRTHSLRLCSSRHVRHRAQQQKIRSYCM